jgi:hypothetical protein
MSRRDPVRLALEHAAGLEAVLAGDPELADLAYHLGPLVTDLRARAGLLDITPPARNGFASFWARFWPAYPVKVGKLAAEKAAQVARRRPDWPGDEEVLACLERQKGSARWRAGTIPNPQTWFNQGRWSDDPASLTAIGGNGKVRDEAPAGLPEELRRRWPLMDRHERAMTLENLAVGGFR